MKKNKRIRRILSVALALIMTATMTVTIPAGMKTVKAAQATVSNPRVEFNTRDTIEFGHYLQEDTNGDGTVDDKDEKQPIKWQILSVNGNDLFLLADKALDCKKYNEVNNAVTWETCTLREWLNDTSSDESFINTAFTETEQNAIATTTVMNAAYPEYYGGNNTADKVYLLSLDEVTHAYYGFRSDGEYHDQSRICEVTAYAKKQGAYTGDEGGYTGDEGVWWWLRSPSNYARNYAVGVDSNGCVDVHGNDVYYSKAVRPALHLNLSSLNSSDYKLCGKEHVSVKSATYDLVELGNYDGKVLQWRVLSKDGNDVFLLADRYLTLKKYNEVTWDNCTIRNWLNDSFYNSAFNSREKMAIKEPKYVNADYSLKNTENDNYTNDKVTLLSLTDIVNPNYGFPTKYCCYSETRVATHLEWYGTNSEGWHWRLRSPGNSSDIAAFVGLNGYVDTDQESYYSSSIYSNTRPALHLDLSSLSSLKVVGTVIAGEDGIKYYNTEGKRISGKVPDSKHTHSYGGWKVTKAATVFKTGTKIRTCSSCKKTETATIAKLKPTIKLSKTKATLKKGKKLTVKVSKLAKGDCVKFWKSSNNKVATVTSKGKIKAKKKGEAKITVTLKSGKKATVKVTVK